MQKYPNTEKRIAGILDGMKKALPEIKRQVDVYKTSLLVEKQVVNNVNTVHSKNV